ncbi:MAG: hypothetical protein QXZ08_01400 [Nitrososphaeria archaeon]
MKTGDTVRIHRIAEALARAGYKIIFFTLSFTTDRLKVSKHANVIYVLFPRLFYKVVSKVLNWRSYDLDPLIKLTHYIDEAVFTTKIACWLKGNHEIFAIYIFGAMTSKPCFLRLLGISKSIFFDPLGNYAQTLFIQSRNSFLRLIKYGLYLAIHGLSIKASNVLVYPSDPDRKSAERLFRLRKTIVIPNPLPVWYESFEEYTQLRNYRREFDKPYFILLAGGKSSVNREAVMMTIRIFNELPKDKFKLKITGPWEELMPLVKNSSIELMGVIPNDDLKKLLAMSDYGLSPVFSHVAGTFLKILSYISADLNIICSYNSIANLDKSLINQLISSKKIHLIKNFSDYKQAVQKNISSPKISFLKNPVLSDEFDNILKKHFLE